MARAYASTILKAPVETVWSLVRDFNALPKWAPGDRQVQDRGWARFRRGRLRALLSRQDGGHIRERLLTLDDANYTFTYNFEKPAFPVRNYIATLQALSGDPDGPDLCRMGTPPSTRRRATKANTRRSSPARSSPRTGPISREDHRRQEAEEARGGRPLEGLCAEQGLDLTGDAGAGRESVWGVIRDFAGMGAWHEDIPKMHMIDGVRSDKVSGVRDFYFGPGHLHEELLHLCDRSAPSPTASPNRHCPGSTTSPAPGFGRSPATTRPSASGPATGMPARRTT